MENENINHWRIGTVVSRDGTDEHLIYSDSLAHYDTGVRKVDYWGNNMEVVCIKASAEGWCEIGETESNLTRRYEFLYQLVNWQDKLREIGRADLIK